MNEKLPMPHDERREYRNDDLILKGNRVFRVELPGPVAAVKGKDIDVYLVDVGGVHEVIDFPALLKAIDATSRALGKIEDLCAAFIVGKKAWRHIDWNAFLTQTKTYSAVLRTWL